MRFEVCIHETKRTVYYIDAESEDAAEEIALNLYNDGIEPDDVQYLDNEIDIMFES